MNRRRVYIEVAPGVAERAVVIGDSIFPWLAKVIARGVGGGRCWRGLAPKRDIVERSRQ